jgi:hypothetical protein
MTAFYVKVSTRTDISGNYSFDVPLIYAHLNYSIVVDTRAHLLLNFATNTYEGAFGVDMNISGGLTAGALGIDIITVNLSASGGADLRASYSSGNFSVEGNVYAQVKMAATLDSDHCTSNNNCDNDYCTTQRLVPTGFRLCAAVKARMSWSSRYGFGLSL